MRVAAGVVAISELPVKSNARQERLSLFTAEREYPAECTRIRIVFKYISGRNHKKKIQLAAIIKVGER